MASKIKVNVGHLKRDGIKNKEKKNQKEVKEEAPVKKAEEKIETAVTTFSGNNLLPENLGVTFEISEDKKINNFLIRKSEELTRVQASARLHLGQIFQDVYDELGRIGKYDGLYVKWLELNGYNKMTALRHRKRLEMFNEMKSDSSKSIIATISQDIINKLLKHEDKEKIIEKLNNSMTRQDLIDLFSNNRKEQLEPPHNFNLEENYKKFEAVFHNLDLNSLSENKKEKLEKLLEQFFKLIG